jgi:propanol-preferring alcohol dehydrogenase
MKAMLLDRIYDLNSEGKPLRLTNLPVPEIQCNEILIKVHTCGVCHTELDEIEGRTPPPVFPMVLGHQIVGTVVFMGKNAKRFKTGARIGIGWIYHACGDCARCASGNENLCDQFQATGRDANGGYAEFVKVDENFAHHIPDTFSDSAAAPLLCAGAIGYRSLRLSGLKNGEILGLTGFGASAHLVLHMVKHRFPDSPIFVFARSKNEREFALELGAQWAGDTDDIPPELLHCIIDTTPVWKPIVEALLHLEPGGRLVINAIRKEIVDQEYLLKLNYAKHLWLEKEIKSVANVARNDISEFLQLASEIPISPEFQEYTLDEANIALMELKQRKIRGAKVLKMV